MGRISDASAATEKRVLTSFRVTNVPDWLRDPNTQRYLAAAVTILIIILIARAASKMVAQRVDGVDARYHARKLIRFVAFALSAIVVVIVFSARLAGFTVAFGVAGAGIAFALQEVIASIAGWIAVLSGGFYGTGDRVQLGGIKGDVIDIGVLRTTLMECGEWVDGDLYNGRIVRVANSFVFKAPVVNYTADFPFLWDEIKVPVRFGSDRAAARALLEQSATQLTADFVSTATQTWASMVRKFRIEDARIEPLITLIANDNWIEYTVRYIVDYRQRRAMKDKLFTKILDGVDESKGRIVLASATFELVAAPSFNVRVGSPLVTSVPPPTAEAKLD